MLKNGKMNTMNEVNSLKRPLDKLFFFLMSLVNESHIIT